MDGYGPLSVYRFEIPPGAERHQLGPVSRTFTKDSEIINLMPHMHMRGSGAQFEAFYPDGTSEVLLEVPDYDFSWQTVYRFRDLKFVPAGTRIEYTAWFENTPERAAVLRLRLEAPRDLRSREHGRDDDGFHHQRGCSRIAKTVIPSKNCHTYLG